MRNNNQKSIWRLIFRSLRSNKARNFFVLLAVVLTTVLITSVFSIGTSFMETNALQETLFVGTVADAHISGLFQEQINQLSNIDYIKTVGLQKTIGTTQTVSAEGRQVSILMQWYDRTEWEAFRAPAATDIVGWFPQAYHDIMVPVGTLGYWGIEHPEIGMEIPLTYSLEEEPDERIYGTFILTGYYTEYVMARAKDLGYVVVSEEFAKANCGGITADVSLSFDGDGTVAEYSRRLADDLSLSQQQTVEPWRPYSGSNISNMLAIGLLVGFIMLTGYLLIYNVLYISVAKDIRFYGLLKAVGTTPKQIRKIVTGQALLLSAVGIPIGLLCGALISVVLVPTVLGATLLEIQAGTSFNSVIYICAALFSLITVFISTRSPAVKASKTSPQEAMRFTEALVKRKASNTTSGGKIHIMAWRNVFRDRKRAVIVLLSLFLSITIFMATTSLVDSMGVEHYIAAFLHHDFELNNKTTERYAGVNDPSKEFAQKFDEEFLLTVGNLDGVYDLETFTMDYISVPYDADKYAKHLEDFFSRNIVPDLPGVIAGFEGSFTGYIIGIDIEVARCILEEEGQAIDAEAFRRGDFALIETDDPDSYQAVQSMNITLGLSGVDLEIPIGGFLPHSYLQMRGGGAPNIYVSQEYLNKLSPSAPIGKILFNVDDAYEQQALEQVISLCGMDPEIDFISKIEMVETMENEKGMLSILGNSLSIILALIGILNFVNIMSTSIISRRRELAMLESVGMTRGQIRKMINLEGMIYAALSSILVAVLGSAVTYGLFFLLNQAAAYVVFSYPLMPLVVSIFVIFAVCITTTELAFKSSNKQSVVERLRDAE